MEEFTYNGMTCDINCDDCIHDKCIFEIDIKENNMVKQNDLTKINYCNDCVCSIVKECDCSHGQLNNWYCSSKGTKRILEMSVLNTATIKIPHWCPMGLYKKPSAIPVTEATKNETKQELSWMERKKLWEAIRPTCEWDNIKVNDIYHVPPIMDEKRMDIIITNKTDFSFQYKHLSKTKEASTSCIYTVYKTGFWWKLMSKHKLKKIEVRTK